MKNFLTKAGQQALIDECRIISMQKDIGSWYVPQYESGKKVRLKQMCLGDLKFIFFCQKQFAKILVYHSSFVEYF